MQPPELLRGPLVSGRSHLALLGPPGAREYSGWRNETLRKVSALGAVKSGGLRL